MDKKIQKPENLGEQGLTKYDNPFRPLDEEDQENSDSIDEERRFSEDEDLWLMSQEF